MFFICLLIENDKLLALIILKIVYGKIYWINNTKMYVFQRYDGSKVKFFQRFFLEDLSISPFFSWDTIFDSFNISEESFSRYELRSQ